MSETTENPTDHRRDARAELPAYKSALLEDLEEAMRDVVDPELGVNVVDLGLVYGIDVDESNVAILDMTLTSAACPLTDVIEDQCPPGADRRPRPRAWSTTSGSTGSGCRRGARTRSPTTAASSCARSASASDRPAPRDHGAVTTKSRSGAVPAP